MTKITDRNKDLVSRVYEEMWNQGNFIVARQIIAQPAGVERFMQEFLSALPNLQHKVDVE